MLATTVVDFGPIRSYWKELGTSPTSPRSARTEGDASEQPLFYYPQWGRFMRRDRFDELVRHLQLDTFTSDDIRQDPCTVTMSP
jgi:hypothetical protein